MTQTSTDVQSDFLNALVAERKSVWVFLVNGIRLTGLIEAYDNYVIAVQSPTGIQTIYKNAISTVCEPHEVPGGASARRASVSRGERPPRR